MKCEFCKEPCGNKWCSAIPTSEELQDSKDEEFANMFNKNWVKSKNYNKVARYLIWKQRKFNDEKSN